MTLEDWVSNHWLKKEPTAVEEIAELFEIVDRDLKQAANANISGDWRLAMAFNAALQCAAIALRASGYRLPVDEGHHKKTIDSLKHTINPDSKLIERLDGFRRRRSKVTYDTAGTATEAEVKELIKTANELRDQLKKWLRSNHPKLLK
jgi:hypothetical protein